MSKLPPRPRCVPVFRVLGGLCALAGATLTLAGVGLLLGLGAASDTAAGAALLALGALAGFASAMLIGFAANLEILHDIRVHQCRGPGGDPRARGRDAGGG